MSFLSGLLIGMAGSWLVWRLPLLWERGAKHGDTKVTDNYSNSGRG